MFELASQARSSRLVGFGVSVTVAATGIGRVELFGDGYAFFDTVLERAVTETGIRSGIECSLIETRRTATCLQLACLRDCCFERAAGSHAEIHVVDRRAITRSCTFSAEFEFERQTG
ncbi:hypothetical protein SY87_33220 [Burkholderia pseudomallei]|nr:hypothetical protein SY87_33220 [Burkholderia pseudomallei]